MDSPTQTTTEQPSPNSDNQKKFPSEDGYEDILGSGGVLLKRISSSTGNSDLQNLQRPEYKQYCTFRLRGRIYGAEPKTFMDNQILETSVGDNIIEIVPPGVMLALRMMGVSEICHLRIDSRYGYGNDGHVGYGIPPDALLEYEIEMLQVGSPQKEPADMSMEELTEAVLKYKTRGNEYFGWNQFDRALRCFKEGARHGEQAIQNLGGDEKANQENAVLFANIVACINNMATVLERQGKLKEAKEATVQVLIADPLNIKALLRGARISLQQGEHEEAIAAIQVAKKFAPDNPAVQEMDVKIRNAIILAKKIEKERWGGFLKPAVPSTTKGNNNSNSMSTSTSTKVDESVIVSATASTNSSTSNDKSESSPMAAAAAVSEAVSGESDDEKEAIPTQSTIIKERQQKKLNNDEQTNNEMEPIRVNEQVQKSTSNNRVSNKSQQQEGSEDEDEISRKAPPLVRFAVLMFPSLVAMIVFICWFVISSRLII
jgi:tetratricopeptide (TPR) repeat protein